MRRLLILPLILGLIVYSYSGEKVKEKDVNSSKNLNPPKDIPLYEGDVDVYNSNFNEMNVREDVNQTDSNFTLTLGADVNTTKERAVVLSATVTNATNSRNCNYFWRENGTLFAMGARVEKAFSKGEHKLDVEVKCDSNETAVSSMVVTAYDYYVVIKSHYNAYYGDLEYQEREVYNHKGRALLIDDGIFSKDRFNYNEKGETVEHQVLYYIYPDDSRMERYTYDAKGNKLTEKVFNTLGEMLYIAYYTYDDKGNLLSKKSGANEDNLVEENYNDTSAIIYSDEVYIEGEADENHDIKRVNDDGLVTYEEYNCGTIKMSFEYIYDENQQLLSEVYHVDSEDRNQVKKTVYNSNGNVVSSEREYQFKERVGCHYRSSYNYNKEGNMETRQDVLLGGECPYLDEVKQVFSYDSEGNMVSIKAEVEGVAKGEGYTTYKVEKFYTNEVELY